MIKYGRAEWNLLKSLLGFIWFDQILEDLKLTSRGLCWIYGKDHFNSQFSFIIEWCFSSRSLKKLLFFFSFIDIVDCCFCKNVKNKYKKKNIRKWWRPNLASLLMLIIVESDFKMLYYWRRKTILYNSVWKYFTRS